MRQKVPITKIRPSLPDPPLHSTLPRAIRAARISQEEFARRMQIHPSYVSLMCAGKRIPSLQLAQRMAAELRVTLDAMCSMVGLEPIEPRPRKKLKFLGE